MVRVFTGTSGFSFDEWRGHFYPTGLAPEARLGYYASRLPCVEINNTFYQMPKRSLLERWRDTVPESFRFALKAPRRLTHTQRLRAEGDTLGYFLDAAASLGPALGPVLFQLPPFLRKDVPLLSDFLAKLPPSILAAFEFRHSSWFDDEVFALLGSKNAALCGGDSDEGGYAPPQIATADFGYLRLRAPSYDATRLRDWSERILAERWTNAYVFLKHEVLGPAYAGFVAAVVAGAAEPVLPSELDAQATSQTTPVTLAKGSARTRSAEARRAREHQSPRRRQAAR
ncbi:MAG TPA: DUF72 domain-containing protein [Polyangiaceae bacterium]|nr:DUF72 domain-containing protein [Polyangiaceae bacterium]